MLCCQQAWHVTDNTDHYKEAGWILYRMIQSKDACPPYQHLLVRLTVHFEATVEKMEMAARLFLLVTFRLSFLFDLPMFWRHHFVAKVVHSSAELRVKRRCGRHWTLEGRECNIHYKNHSLIGHLRYRAVAKATRGKRSAHALDFEIFCLIRRSCACERKTKFFSFQLLTNILPTVKWFSHGTFCRIGWSYRAHCKQKWKCMPPGTSSLATGQSCYDSSSEHNAYTQIVTIIIIIALLSSFCNIIWHY